MYVCVCVCVCVCECVCMHACVFIVMYVCVCVYGNIYAHIFIVMCVFTHRQDVTRGWFLSEVQFVSIQSFPSFSSVIIPKLKSPISLTINS